MTRSMSLNEKILEEAIGDVKKMDGTGGKLFNEAIGQMTSTIVREEDKRKEEKEIKSDTGTMIDCYCNFVKFFILVESSS